MVQGTVTPESSSSHSTIPLNWTRIKRGKRKRASSSKDESSSSTFCCDDDSCPATEEAEFSNNTSNASREEQRSAKFVTLKGKALFCLHTLDCTWFQGQFMNSDPSWVKSLGILAKQREDIDECLKCGDGGYKEIDLSLFQRGKNSSLKSKSGTVNGRSEDRKKIVMSKLSCTGGDMLQIRTPQKEDHKMQKEMVSFDADRIVTGAGVESLVHRYFSNLLPDSSDGSFAEQLPDCAIVFGTMTLCLPSKFLPPISLFKVDNDDNEMSDQTEES